MLIIPIRTECSVRHPPRANMGLIALNVVIFFIFDFTHNPALAAFKRTHFVLDSEFPQLYQFITYQFGHADMWHLFGNMLFLWVFGNGVNAKLGDVPYVLFYLAGGAFAGLIFSMRSTDALLGASGSISAVTAAYLVLFPRSRVTIFYWFFIFGFADIPATIIILVKIVLWDNVIGPALQGPSQVAHTAHMAGYFFGFAGAMVMLFIRAVNRDQFDMLALFKRWNQRRAFAAAMADPRAQAQAQYGKVARIPADDPQRDAEWTRRIDARTELRAQVADHLRSGALPDAVRAYERLVADDPKQCLPADQQMAIGRTYYATGRFPQAAAAFERFLGTYRHHNEANEVRLLLGIINARDLRQFETAEKYLRDALRVATNPTRRAQAQRWLAEVAAARGKG